MKILVFGANGFIGRAVVRIAQAEGCEVYEAMRTVSHNVSPYRIEVALTDPQSVYRVVHQIKPDVVVNAAGVVDVTKDVTLNKVFTVNIIEAVYKANLLNTKIVICGSAGEYGTVTIDELPVHEDTPLRATSEYGRSKIDEERTALELAKVYGLHVIVARVFNPLGPNMADKFLTTRLKLQIKEYIQGERQRLEVSHKDSKRDYLHVDDVAGAILAIAKGPFKNSIYNVGSGVATSNYKLLQLMLKNSKVDKEPEVIETSDSEEPLVAIQANVDRIKNDYGWFPSKTIEDSVKEILRDE